MDTGRCWMSSELDNVVSYKSTFLIAVFLLSVLGTFIPAKHCARIFVEQKTPGSIVMIASMSGQIANRVSLATD
jgi:NAD(P)-dependent dehydrogenase (short-subunit alcohol dehydrogenase family)